MSGRPEHRAETRVTDADFAAAFAPLVTADQPIAVAVSGGADSMALLRLAQAWAAARGVPLFALTVDHQLRDNSAREAQQVAAWCASLGVQHAILAWAEGPAQRDLTRSPQASARAARYALMTAWCRARDIQALCLAHHADDQVETFLIRLARGSGVDGLAAMAATTARDGVRLVRPLLAFPKAALVATCRALGQAWIEDPSNANAAATRVRFRQARDLLAAEGLTTDRLLATVGHMQRARAAIDASVRELLSAACRWDAYGVARFRLDQLLAAPAEVGLRALAQALTLTSGGTYGPRFESLEGAFERLGRGPWRDASLHGCLLQRSGAELVLLREAAAIVDQCALAPGGSVRWDGRFTLTSPPNAPATLRVTAMTSAGWDALKGEGGPKLGPAVRASLPLLCDDRGPAGVPTAGIMRADLRLALAGQEVRSTFAPDRHVADLPPFASL